jgi:hypothetical protein
LGHGKLRCLFRYTMDYMDLLLKSPDVTLATLTFIWLGAVPKGLPAEVSGTQRVLTIRRGPMSFAQPSLGLDAGGLVASDDQARRTQRGETANALRHRRNRQLVGHVQVRDKSLDRFSRQAAVHRGTLRHAAAGAIVEKAGVCARGFVMIVFTDRLIVGCPGHHVLILGEGPAMGYQAGVVRNGINEQRRQRQQAHHYHSECRPRPVSHGDWFHTRSAMIPH